MGTFCSTYLAAAEFLSYYQPGNNWCSMGKRRSMNFHAVIFDLDGTLLDTLGDLAGSMNRVLQQFGFPGHPPEAYKYFVGEGMVNLARRALPPTERREDLVASAVEALQAEYSRCWQTLTRPYPDIPELLQALSRQGVKLGVLTNKSDDMARLMVRAYLPDIGFTAVAGAAPGRPLKPDPSGALGLAREFALAADAIVFVGDSGIDMLTAGSAGMYAVGALWGFRTAGELQAAGARALIETPAELLKLFNC
jgi:phosphoglycolate phosphatase